VTAPNNPPPGNASGKIELKSDKPEKKTNKKLQKTIEALKSPIVVGIFVTGTFVFVTTNFYNVRSQQESSRLMLPAIKRLAFEAVEWFDLKNQDRRLVMRGQTVPSEQVALLTIDDRSIEEIGRWPWSREKIAFVVDEMMKYKAKAIGFDIVFSEPQVDQTFEAIKRIEEKGAGQLTGAVKAALEDEKSRGQPDTILAGTLTKSKEKIVLGAFNEESDDSRLLAYQDYCRNEAFRRSNAEKFVKLNVTFIVNDEADPFVDLEFDQVFDNLFPALEVKETNHILKDIFNKKDVAELTDLEKRQLKYLTQTANMRYCESWLTKDDPWMEDIKPEYKKIFAKSKDLKDLPINEAIEKFKTLTKSLPIVQHQRWTINTDEIQEGIDYTGSFNAEQDSDGTIRKASLFFRTGNRIGTSFIPSIALQTYLIATGYRANVEINIDPRHPEQKTLTKFDIVDPTQDPEVLIGSVPVDAQARMNINYAGGKNMYPYLPAKELFNGKETAVISKAEWNPETRQWNERTFEVNKADFIKDKSFIFGATAIGVYDLRVTPFEKNYPGPETHVTTLGNLFERNFLKAHPQEEKFMPWLIVVFGIILSIAISQTTAIPGFLITFGSVGGIVLLDQFFLKKGIMVTMTLPGGLILFLYIFLFFYKYLTEERKKKHLRSTFSKYVSPAIVDEILKDPENIELGGKKQRMSVFFSDVRGFTTISEKLDPRALSDVLTKYLTPMTQIVFANKGTLDKYMGDALMAFFGAPIVFPDHAKYACRTALQSLEKLKELQKEFKAQGLPEIDIGIGINSAEMSVGNMGSDIVRSYTVMGDAVNLASRLEGINKEYGTRVVISQFTYEDVKSSFTCREIDWVRVKGKNEPVRIFELVCEGPAKDSTASLLQNFNSGFELYHQRKFSEALLCFQKALNDVPGDPVSELYVERCNDYLAETPSENWDGVYVMKTK
jgi:adenylate cyclase